MNKTIFQLAITALRRQKTRAILTMVAISIGIAAVVVMSAAGKGLEKMVISELDVFGPNTIEIEVKVPSVKKTSSENAMGLSTGITITTLKDRDIDSVRQHPNIEYANGSVMGQESVSYGGQIKKVVLMGHGWEQALIDDVKFASGRFFTKEEEESLNSVAVLGNAVKQKMFGDDEAIGKTIYVKGKPFKVVGVMAKRGAAFFFDIDNMVTLPTKTMQKKLLGINYVMYIMAKMKDRTQAKQTAVELTEIIRANHGITDPDKDDFAVNTMEEAKAILKTIIGALTLLLIALVCISLVVGGVGIMNIMYVSVAERKFEIGLRKSVGARRQDILWQFLDEAVILTTGGGVLGIVLGALLAFVIYIVAISYGFKWSYILPFSSILLSLGFSAFIGILFGVYPAKKAASLNPIEALRRE
ncbi:FtsX-like permease family protein [Patescibacteria group bacterium]|nr:MAG: FtsX-like permease family protein [Patescibacteria group bacterium]